MKTIYYVSVIAAALLFFASCQKENLVSDNQQPVLRTITASFENSGTKTTLGENDIPLWKVGDVIRLLDATTYDDITLTSEMINGRSVTFTTELTGETLYAVYPASATAMDKCTDGSITFAIPVVQDGTFGSANICVAKGDDKDNLVFSNATAVLEFSQNNPSSTGVIRVAVEAANNIAGTLTATFGADNKATVSASGLANKTIFTKAVSTPVDKYYVAVAPGVATGEVNFKYYKALQEASGSESSATLAKNTIYTLSIPVDGYEKSYVEITMTVGGVEKTYKWAKVNIGATKPEDCGHCFAWGYADGCIRNSSDNGWVLASDNTTAKKFNTTDFPNRNTSSFQDAATVNWGESWRMPTKEEFDALANLKKGDFASGYNFGISDDAQIFLPAAGYGSGTDFKGAGVNGIYWSSTVGTASPSSACILSFKDGNANVAEDARFYGRSVRALLK